jgi:hypothetical protein
MTLVRRLLHKVITKLPTLSCPLGKKRSVQQHIVLRFTLLNLPSTLLHVGRRVAERCLIDSYRITQLGLSVIFGVSVVTIFGHLNASYGWSSEKKRTKQNSSPCCVQSGLVSHQHLRHLDCSKGYTYLNCSNVFRIAPVIHFKTNVSLWLKIEFALERKQSWCRGNLTSRAIQPPEPVWRQSNNPTFQPPSPCDEHVGTNLAGRLIPKKLLTSTERFYNVAQLAVFLQCFNPPCRKRCSE